MNDNFSSFLETCIFFAPTCGIYFFLRSHAYTISSLLLLRRFTYLIERNSKYIFKWPIIIRCRKTDDTIFSSVYNWLTKKPRKYQLILLKRGGTDIYTWQIITYMKQKKNRRHYISIYVYFFLEKKTEEHYFINWSGFFGSYLQSFGVARLCLSIFSLKGKKSRKIGWVVLLQASSLVSSRGTVSASTAAPLTSVSQVQPTERLQVLHIFLLLLVGSQLFFHSQCRGGHH